MLYKPTFMLVWGSDGPINLEVKNKAVVFIAHCEHVEAGRAPGSRTRTDQGILILIVIV